MKLVPLIEEHDIALRAIKFLSKRNINNYLGDNMRNFVLAAVGTDYEARLSFKKFLAHDIMEKYDVIHINFSKKDPKGLLIRQGYRPHALPKGIVTGLPMNKIIYPRYKLFHQILKVIPTEKMKFIIEGCHIDSFEISDAQDFCKYF
jgi:hypothetical protein